MRAVAAAGFLIAALLAAQVSGQVSLWGGAAQSAKSGAAQGAPSNKPAAASTNVLREVKARDFKVHDIVSIVVLLSAEASTDEKANAEKKTDKVNFAIEQYLKLHKNDGNLLGVDLQGKSPTDLGVAMNSDRKMDAQGTADRKDTLRTKLAAEIVDIKPNGNLVIEAKQTVMKQREKTTITFSGTVRPQDVGPDNTVYSYNVADADVRYESSGPVTDMNKHGWLSRILDKIWPF